MDRRDAMSLPGFASYAMQTGMSRSPGMNPFSNLNFPAPHQPNLGNCSTESALVTQQSSAVSPYSGNVSVPPSEPKRKRGRPKKYSNDETDSTLAVLPSSTVPSALSTPKKGRGRPAGSGKNQLLASLGDWQSRSAGTGFTPHVITVAIGEDIASKIMSFSQQRSRVVCILSASGSVSSVTLHQPSTPGGIVTYTGHFVILCLSGSYLPTDSGTRSGGLNISLANHDGRVIGGGVGGTLIAATHIQVIAGSFLWGDKTSKTNDNEIEDTNGGIDSHIQTVNNSVTPNSQHRNLNPSMDAWPGSHSVNARNVHARNVHADFDLMSG